MKSFNRMVRTSLILILLLLSGVVLADTWAEFRGNNRDGVSTETGLLKSWPANGPKLLWKVTGLGDGYSSAVIANNTVYVTGATDKKEYLYAFDLAGKLKWKQQYGDVWYRSYPDPRTSPTFNGNRLYVVSGMGQVVSLDAATGKVLWTIDMIKTFNGEFHRWGISESPVVDDKYVYCTPGGPDATMAALDKNTGKTIWVTKGLSDVSNYCSPLMIKRGGKNILMTQVENHFIGVDAANGKLLWKVVVKDLWPKNKSININTPLYKDGQVFITAGYNSGSAMFELSADGASIKTLWVDTTLDVHHGGVVTVDGYIYGSNWLNNNSGNWVCLDWKTGKVMYETEWINKGAIIYADGMLYVYEEKDGTVGIAKATPDGFNVVSSFEFTEGGGPNWAHPSISNGVLYMRHGDVLHAYNIKAK